MNDKRVFIGIPVVLLPYFTLFCVATIFFSTRVDFFRFVMESVFQSNLLYVIAALFLYGILCAVLSILCFALSIRQKWDALSLAKLAMIIKLIQIPAYLLIFILGLMLSFTVLAIPFAVGLFLIDCLAVFSTGLPVAASVVIAVRQGTIRFKDGFWIVLLQFVFCADVVASVIFYNKLKKIHKPVSA